MNQETHILLVEDDLNFGLILFDRLKDAGFKPHWAKDGKEGLRVFNAHPADICLIDVMMPEKDGFSLVEDIRKLNKQVPVLMLTAKSQIDDKVKGFNAGADDYLTKPFDFQELLLRIHALLKRTSGEDKPTQPTFTIGTYEFTPAELLLRRGSLVTKLTKREAETLTLLAKHQNQVIEREVVLNMIWGNDNYFNGRSLDVFISRLRKYLNQDPQVEIQNIHGKGFVLRVTSAQ